MEYTKAAADIQTMTCYRLYQLNQTYASRQGRGARRAAIKAN